MRLLIILKFFDALSMFVNEIEIKIEQNAVSIVTTDLSRIGLMEIIFNSKFYQFYRTGKVGINVEDFSNKLKCTNDNSEVRLIFSEQLLEMHITSPKRKRTIKRTLNTIAFEPQCNSIGSLNGIVAPYTFEMIKDDSNDLMKNSGYYSEIIEVKVDGKCVFFNESSQQGESEIFYKKNFFFDG